MTEGNNPPPPPASPVPPSSPPPTVDYQTPGGGYNGPPADQDAKNLSLLAHLLNIIFLVPLLVYLLKKDSHPFLADQSREALNFSLTCLIIHLVCSFTAFLCIPAIIALVVMVCQIVFGIIGGLKAKDGIPYRYPLTFRFIK
jgi:uncharacterized Tic20 family protein